MNAGFHARFQEARALRRGGRLEEAVAAYDAALALHPASLEARFNRANTLQALGRHADAVAAYEALLQARPEDAEAWNNRAVSLAALGRQAQSLASCEEALALRPGYPEALHNRGNALAALGRLDEALESLDAALQRRPELAAALASRARVLERVGRNADALADYEAALRLRPGDAGILCDQSHALQVLGRHAEALAVLAEAPDAAPVLTNRGNALQALGRHGEALACYQRALAASPGDVQVEWNMALAYLALGDYERGWPLYEARWRSALHPAPRTSEQPQWTGEGELAGRRVLLHAEQGFGDAIQFVRFARPLAARGAEVIVACAPPLRRLFERADGVARVVVPGHEPLPAFDLHAPLMSLPLALGTTLQSLPPAPYLHADPARREAWRARLAGGRRRIGLVWAGNPEFPAARLKACPPALLRALVQAPGCRFVSLQTGEARAGVSELGAGVLDAAGELADFADTADLVAALDLVIGIDTAAAHLAGALGKPAWILLPFAADWRWLVGRADSPWYPSVRLYRQAAPGDWPGVIARVCADLAQGDADG